MNLSGSPKFVSEVQDQSIIQSVPLAGIGIVQGPTNRGKIGEAVFIGNSIQFRRKMGADYTAGESQFPTLCRRILDAGAKLWIIRSGHYTDVTDKSTLVGTKANATITVGANNSIWNAEDVGPGYNGTTIVVVNASSGTANKKDITITLKDSDISTKVLDVDRVMNAGAISDFNLKLKGLGAGVILVSIATQIENGTGTLAAGAQVVSAIVAVDYTGDRSQSNGWFASANVRNSMRIANISMPGDQDVDEGLRAYAVSRNDMRFYLGTPLGVNSTGMAAYRAGTTPYAHAAIDTYLGTLVGGDVSVQDQTKKQSYTIPGVVDTFIARLITDIKFGPAYSEAGIRRGKIISPNNGIPYDLGSPANAADFDLIYPQGVNAVINDPDYGPVYWGNRSLQINPNTSLAKENCADGIVYIQRGLAPLVRPGMFDPVDPTTWKQIYRSVLPFIQDLERLRIIRPGEGNKWFWQGDQDADTIDDVTFNNPADLDSGRYLMRFVFVLIPATEFMGLQIVPTDSNSVKFIVQQGITV